MPAESKEKRLSFAYRVMLLALACWAVWNWSITIWRIHDLRVVLPTWDYWREAEVFPRLQAFDFRFLWRQHNEHRILFPELIFSVDMLAFRGRELLPLIASFLFYLGCGALLAYSILSETAILLRTRLLVVLICAVLLGWKASSLVLAEPFLLQWTLAEFSILAAFVLLGKSTLHDSFWFLCAAICAGVVATYSSGNGLLLWPVLLGAGYVLGLNRKRMLVLALSGVASDGLYFVGYQFSKETNAGNVLAHPLYAVSFIGAYLSMPFGAMKTPGFGVAVGLTGLVVAIALAIVAMKAGVFKTPIAVLLFGTYAFTLLTGVLTAAGRMEPEDGAFGNAKAVRYLVPVIVNWAALISAAIWVAAVKQWRILNPTAIGAVVVILMGISFVKLRRWILVADRSFTAEQVTQLAIENGVLDDRLIRKIFPDPGFVRAYLPVLQAAGLSIYSGSMPLRVGQSVAQSYAVSSGKLAGAVTRTFPVQGGLKIVGWSPKQSGLSLALVNGAGQVIGLGRRLPHGLPDDYVPAGTPRDLAWIAFVPERFARESFAVFVLERNRTMLRAAGSYQAAPVRPGTPEDLRSKIGGIAWKMDSSWTRGGIPPNGRITPVPPGMIYGSWSGSDQNTGALETSSFETPANRCVVVPVLHGPYVQGQSVTLLDGESGKAIAEVPLEDGDVQWESWRIQIPAGVRMLQIRGRDGGEKFGNWIALSDPAVCP